jgi:RNA polymerase sigma factor (sigma-70 family)
MQHNETFFKAIKGDPRSISAVVEQWTPLVHKIVAKYAWMAPSHSREDLVQEGLCGVLHAIRTFEPERGYKFMTWVYPQVRGAVTSLARKENRNPRYPLSLEQSDWGCNLEDSHKFEVRDDLSDERVRKTLVAGCKSLDSPTAQMICDRFGLLGHTEMRQGEVAKKYGMTKQAFQSRFTRFSKKVRETYPELEGLI